MALSFRAGFAACCGRCDLRVMLCNCEGVVGRQDLWFMGLPKPARDATRGDLIDRWVSIMLRHPAVPLDADRWKADYKSSLLAALRVKEVALRRMMALYSDALSSNPSAISNLPVLKSCSGEDSVDGLQALFVRAMERFTSGHWSAMTRMDVNAVYNAFGHTSVYNADEFPTTDPILKTLFDCICFLMVTTRYWASDTVVGFRISLESGCELPPDE